jgi:hypothetical protein
LTGYGPTCQKPVNPDNQLNFNIPIPYIMMLVHSAYRPFIKKPGIQAGYPPKADQHEYLIKCAAYRAACAKYSAEIEAVQKFFPGWLPNPPTK